MLLGLPIAFTWAAYAGVLGQARTRPLTHAEAAAALSRANRIKPGMTMAQAWKAIGLYDRYPNIPQGRSSGPTNRYRVNYELTDAHRLAVVLDYRTKPPRIVTAQAIWLRPGPPATYSVASAVFAVYRWLPGKFGPVGVAARRQIAAIVNRIDWNHLPSIAELGETLERGAPGPRLGRPPSYNSAAALVLAAWDVRLKRPQYVHRLSKLVAPGGEQPPGSSGPRDETGVHAQWPWKVVGGKLELQPVSIRQIAANVPPYSMSDFVSWWATAKRGR